MQEIASLVASYRDREGIAVETMGAVAERVRDRTDPGAVSRGPQGRP
jgi:hypothetical protein